MKRAAIKLIALPIAIAVLYPMLGWAAVCQAGMQAAGRQEMACCRTMGDRCMHNGARPSPGQGGDCCRHHASAPAPAALIAGHGGLQPGSAGSVSVAAPNRARAFSQPRRQVQRDALSPARSSPSLQFHSVLLI
ncbi:MAG: hypothetical protein ACRD1L_09470 [Terriglobales bacterium]